jgi:hypothetical protein
VGRFLNDGVKSTITEWLLLQGYKEIDNYTGENGLTKVYPINNNSANVSVTINTISKLIHIQLISNHVGLTNQANINIEDDWMNDLNTFIEKVDESLEPWIGK